MTIPGPSSEPPQDQSGENPEVEVTWLTDSQQSSGGFFSRVHKVPVFVALGVLAVAVIVTAVALVVRSMDGSTSGEPSGSVSNPRATPSEPTGTSTAPTPSVSTIVIPPNGPPDFSRAVRAIRPSLVRVVASTCQGTGVGTGFWIDDRTVMTSYQSVAQSVALAVVDQSGKLMVATIEGADPATGVALLGVQGLASGPVVSLGADTLSKGSWVAWVGLPSRSARVSSGTAQVTATDIGFTHRKLRIDRLARIPGRVNLGLGGAPVLGPNGSVAGAIFAVSGRDQRLIVPVDQLQAGVERARHSGSPAAGRCNRPTGPHSQTKIDGDAPDAMLRGLRAYFEGINRADYAAAYDAMGWRYHQHEDSLDKIAPGWVSSYDFNIEVRSTKVTNSVHSAWITFDSIFAAGQGPVDSWTCARWSLDYTFVQDGDRLEINGNKAHGEAEKSYRSC